VSVLRAIFSALCTRLMIAQERSKSRLRAERISAKMRLCWKVLIVAVVLAVPAASQAATCTSQAELSPQDRATLSSVGGRMAQAVVNQDIATLQAALLPAETAEWTGIRGAIEQSAPMVKGGHAQLRSIYLLDASSQTATADTQLFCSNSAGTLTVTVNMHALPPGRYAVVFADATGAPMQGQIGIILAWDGQSWRLGGVSTHPGAFDGHDGVWFWTRARALAAVDPWSAWYSYDAAHFLQLPFDFVSSPNLEKLLKEQADIQKSPENAFPYSLAAGDRTWKIDSVALDPTLNQSDLALAYESSGVTDSAALRTEAIAVFSAFLKAQPGIRANFHGLWAYAVKDGKRTPVMELPMAQIP